jgi:uncharacterized YccA/Bax inhibitor family protein
MALYKSRNPALRTDTFTNVAGVDASETMTVDGTVMKTAILGFVVLAASLFTWNLYQASHNFESIKGYVIGGTIAGLVVAVIIILKKTTAPLLAPVYCALQGLALGGISAFMDEIFPGIVLQAVILTFGILFSLLIIYRLRIIQATENFKLIVASATAGIAFYYLISFAGRYMGFTLPFIHESTTGGIVFSLFVVVIAALNLVIDFDFIEQGAEAKAPRYMEWYGAFGLMVTLIWLYLEILRLLSKLRSK